MPPGPERGFGRRVDPDGWQYPGMDVEVAGGWLPGLCECMTGEWFLVGGVRMILALCPLGRFGVCTLHAQQCVRGSALGRGVGSEDWVGTAADVGHAALRCATGNSVSERRDCSNRRRAVGVRALSA